MWLMLFLLCRLVGVRPGGCTTIFSGCSGLLGLLSVYPVGGGRGCEGRDGGVSGGFGESQYSPALVSLRGMLIPRSAPAK